MTQQPPIDTLLERLRSLFGGTPPTDEALRGVLEGFLKQLQLVPKHELDGHIKALRQLEENVALLEARIAELENSD